MLAQKIMNERTKKGWTQIGLADQLGVSEQEVIRWESAEAVPDLQMIVRLSELFGVTTDDLLKDDQAAEELLPASREEIRPSAEPVRRVSLEEAKAFLHMKRSSAAAVANATALCILSPVILVILGTLSEDSAFHVSEALAAGVGCVALFGMIALAVFMFITCGIRASYSEPLEKESFEAEYAVTEMAKEKRREYEPVFARGLATGVVLCILSVIPTIIAGVAEAPDYICGMAVSLLLLLVAIGVNMIIRVSIEKCSYDTLLQEGDYTHSEKRVRRKMDALSSAYWCIVAAIYLGWSFWTMHWEFTWIVWPIAGALFAAISAVMRARAEYGASEY